jgi:CubicO group peptidase (beta-lactamase class C family)
MADLAANPDDVAEKVGNGVAVAASFGGREAMAGSSEVLRPGSITKVVTATAVMQCVDDGLLSLDDSVSRWVPFLSPSIEVRHLLSHSSGIDAGDVFVDTGDDDGCLDRYIALLADAGSLFAPGHTFSYNNAGMVIAGHLAALVRDSSYEDVVRTHIFERAGMEDATFQPANNGDPICARALAPAGGTLACTALDLVRLVTASLVKPDTAALMRTRQVAAPGGVAPMTGAGLGWQIWCNEHGETIRHGGGYPGHSAIIVADVAAGAVLSLMMALPTGINTMNALLDSREVVARDEAPASLDAYVGDYSSHAMTLTVVQAGDGLTISGSLGLPPFPITPVDRSTFTVAGEPFAFFDFDDRGAPRFLRWRMRVQRRLTSTSG